MDSSSLQTYLVYAILTIVSVSIIPVTYALPEITWNPSTFNIQAKPSGPLTLNFSSNQKLQNISIEVSSQLQGLIPSKLLYQWKNPVTNIIQGQQTFPTYMVILPSVSSGWHNGTITFLANGSVLHNSLHLNVLVPPTISKVVPMSKDVTMATVMSPSYSPFFNNTYDAAQYMVLKNGTYFPMRVYYDISSNMGITQFTKIANNTGNNDGITSEIPEFGSLTGIIVTISIIGVVLISRKFNY